MFFEDFAGVYGLGGNLPAEVKKLIQLLYNVSYYEFNPVDMEGQDYDKPWI